MTTEDVANKAADLLCDWSYHARVGSRQPSIVETEEAAISLRTLSSPPAQEWQDISTAPKDGRPFIYQDSDEAVSTCSWQSDDCGFSWWDIAGDQLAYPVRWMPLPPVAVIAEERGSK